MARRRLRSSTIVLGGVGVLAATLTSCASEPDERCVDPVTYEVLPDYECADDEGVDGDVVDDDDDDDDHGHSNGRYYYGGGVRGNGKVSGGSFDKAAVDTGGFGGSHRSGGG
ncbi:hypothetical protein [Streptomyces sp. NPDC059176]|uniref:hypothetical protein n=1 Tax=unclassified Streptomyces TaxID=2593676 RepID=UPI0036CF424B